MSRQKQYDALMERLNTPQNAELKEKLPLKPNGIDLTFHIMRLNNYFKNWEKSDAITRKLLELDFDVSIRKANEIMDEQGWK